MALVSITEFLARFDAEYVADLTARSGETAEETQERVEARVLVALEDAEAELDGYRPRIPPAKWPGDAVRKPHVVKVATYLLTLNRPGKEFEQIRNAYVDTIDYYKALLPVDSASEASSSLGVSHCAPSAQFTDRSFRGFNG